MSLVTALRGAQQNLPGVYGKDAPAANVAPTDTTGPAMAKYQAELMKYQTEQQKQQALMGALFGLGGSALGGWAMGGFPAFWK